MRAAAHIREYGGTLEHFWIEAVKDRTDAEYLDAREIPASLVTELAADPNGAVLQATNGRPAQLYVIVPVDGTLRISFGAGADLEKAARPERPRISVWMLPRGDLTRSSGLLSQNGADGKAHGTGSAGVYSSNSQCDRQRGIFALSKTFFAGILTYFKEKWCSAA